MNEYLDGQDTLRSNDSEGSQVEFQRLLAAARSLYREFATLDSAIAARLQLHPSDLRCLNELEHGPLSPKQISDRLELSSGSVTALLDRLESLGYVARSKAAHDRRSVVVSLTSQAFETLGPVYQSVAAEMTQCLRSLPAASVETIANGFEVFAQACRSGKARVTRNDRENV